MLHETGRPRSMLVRRCPEDRDRQFERQLERSGLSTRSPSLSLSMTIWLAPSWLSAQLVLEIEATSCLGDL